jgi:tRNA G18 (ribose-2'-O)-methylase SpoU
LIAMNVYLDAPQDFGNVCLIARTLEVLGVRRCYVYDPHRLIRARYGKSRTRRIQAVPAGAFFRVSFERVEDPAGFLARLPGRKVATVPKEPGAPNLACLAFREDDTVVFGSEGRGISPEVLELCEARVTIPQRGVTESLNLAVAVGIVVHEYFRQAGAQADK